MVLVWVRASGYHLLVGDYELTVSGDLFVVQHLVGRCDWYARRQGES